MRLINHQFKQQQKKEMIVQFHRQTNRQENPWSYLPVAVMPHPGVAFSLGTEVRLPVVVDLGGEAQQAAVRAGRGLTGGGG